MIREHLRGRALLCAITLAAGSGFLLIGYDQGVMGGIMTGDPFNQDFSYPGPDMQGFISAIYDLGCFAGAICMFVFGERWGRRKSIIYGAILVIVGTVIQTASYGVPQILIGRAVAGLGNGINTSAMPTWQSELVRAKTRGRSIVFETGLLIIGLAISNWLCYGASFVNSSFQWRFPIAFQMVFAIILLIMMIFLPDSPRWLISHGRVEEARHIISKLANESEWHPVVHNVVQDIIDADLHLKSIGRPHFSEIFSMGETQNLRRVFLGMMPLWMQQLSGINVPSYYLPYLLERSVGIDRNLSLILSGCAAIQYVFFAFLPLLYIDTFGRRKTIIIGCICLTCCMAAIAGTNSVGTRSAGIGTTFFFFLFYDIFGMSLLPVSWMYAPEVNSLRMRTRGSSLGTASHWIANFLVVMITPRGVTNLGYKFYVIWTIINFCFIFINYFLFVETAGRSLEEMDVVFAKYPGWIVRARELKESGHLRRRVYDRPPTPESPTTRMDSNRSVGGKERPSEDY